MKYIISKNYIIKSAVLLRDLNETWIAGQFKLTSWNINKVHIVIFVDVIFRYLGVVKRL